MKTVVRLFVLSFLVLALPGALKAAEQAQALTNADIVKLTKADLGNDLIIAKIQQVEKVDFKLETDDIIQLKKAGVEQAVISAMLKRTSAPPPAPATASSDGGGGFPAVSLVAASGSTALKVIEGDHKQFAAPFVGLRHFLEFDGKNAGTRIKDRRPTLELRLDRNPGAHWWIVRLDPDDDDPTRGLDLQSAGAWGGAHTFEPDEDFVIESTMVEAGGGVWRFKPQKDLKPGEYGLYCEKGYAYDFGVDR
jgi:hypothetical protein